MGLDRTLVALNGHHTQRHPAQTHIRCSPVCGMHSLGLRELVPAQVTPDHAGAGTNGPSPTEAGSNPKI